MFHKAKINSKLQLGELFIQKGTGRSEEINKMLEHGISQHKVIWSKMHDLEIDRDKLKKKINEIVFNQIAKLEAVKMLFSIASSGHTHRSKAMFSEHAKHVIDEEIKATKYNANVLAFDLHDNMPF